MSVNNTVTNSVDTPTPVVRTNKQVYTKAAKGMLAVAAAVALIAFMVVNARSVVLNEGLKTSVICLPALTFGAGEIKGAFTPQAA
ncbi:MAG: hypothetical protein SP1CHLAM54_11930 [Chlamydiia bacterium]|nr:hypothetical protein [Chlamydiia bacterium]MCH9616092.1 hypothetical protein [Chlamydiia bacterium]MCH9629485.1 hypothetical protein [Chlamydiia bacterium]